MEEIVNKVANSTLQIFDLEDYYQEGIRSNIDISQWLLEGLILKEKEFRASLKKQDWSKYQDNFVSISCSTDAVIPSWATILVASHVSLFAKKVVLGNLDDLETSLYQDIIASIDFSIYNNTPVILKGCSKKPVPESAYILAIQNLQKVAKSVMYGEACSAVPLYKRTKIE